MATVLDLKSRKDKKNAKRTVIKDENGYYRVTLGAFNTFNRSGIYYRVPDVNKILGPGSIVHRRINDGVLFAEYLHPDISVYGGDKVKIANRTIQLDATRKIAHIKRIEVEDTGRKEPGFPYNILIIHGWVKPEGPYKDILQEQLDNPDENVFFSVRSLVDQKKIGNITVRDVLVVSTWDYVIEGGIKIANQWNAAGLESAMAIDIDTNVAKELIAGFEHVECKDGKCVIKTLKDRMDELNRTTMIYDW
jgi:hypothetical protein